MADGITRTTLRIPDDLYEQLRRRSFESRRSQQEIMLEALAEYLAKHPKEVE